MRIRRIAFTAVATCALAATGAHASFVSMSPDPFVGGNGVTMGAFHTPFGYVTGLDTAVNEISNTVTAGNDYIDYTGTAILTFYSSPSLTTVVATGTLQAQFDIEIFHRTSPFETGTFSFQYLSSTESGMVDGNSVMIKLNPAETSGGTTTITAGPGLGQYTIERTATTYSQYSIDGGAFINTPGLTVVGVAVPEPSTLVLSAIGAVAGLGVLARRRKV